MPRTNSDNFVELVMRGAAGVAATWDAERKVDAEHIAEHVKASEDALERLNALLAMISDMIKFENERLKSLRSHHDDITTVEERLTAPVELKRIEGGKR